MVDSTNASTASSAGQAPIPIGNDYLQLKHDEVIMSKLKQKEHIVFSCKVQKYNRFGMKQDRFLLLTTHQLCNVKKQEFKREIRIELIKALTKSNDADNKEFIVHIQDEYDYRFNCEQRDELFEQIKAVFFQTMNSNLPIYKVNGKLKEWATNKKDVKNHTARLPPADSRDTGEDWYEPLTKDAKTTPETPLAMDSEDALPSGTHRATFAKKGDTGVTLADFIIKKVIGRGSFGKVFLVQKKDSGEVFAMKSLRKDVILEYDQVESTKLEKEILLKAEHPFLVGMSYVFQTDTKIFFVMRFVRGGELFMHLRQAQRFSEDRARFYAIQVCMAIGALHDKKIIYRDLKPENILMDEDGYVCLTDFGLAKVLEPNAQAFSFCGTPDYLAPEILQNAGHSFPVDWWAVGILTYEMIVGFPPFYTGNNCNTKMYELIKKKPVYFPDPQRHQISMSQNCMNFITGLLNKEPNDRLGSKGGIREILEHPWFKDLDADKILEKSIEAPVKPTLSANVLDVSNFDSAFTNEEALVSVVNPQKKQKIEQFKQAFDGF